MILFMVYTVLIYALWFGISMCLYENYSDCDTKLGARLILVLPLAPILFPFVVLYGLYKLVTVLIPKLCRDAFPLKNRDE